MIMKEPAPVLRIESRVSVILAIFAVLFLLTMLPRPIAMLPVWIPFAAGIMVIVPMAVVGLTAAKARWLRIGRIVTLLFFVFVGVGIVLNLASVIREMVHGSAGIDGLQLLSSSVAVWVANVLVFSILYWQIDRGGPEARLNKAGKRPDWLFPQEGAPVEDVLAGWWPTFVDYLFLGFTTSTAFSPTDTLPLTSRAKILLMLQSTISLATIVVLASRAINILGS
jgi:hypothetical protein